jgi:hypothetical protein
MRILLAMLALAGISSAAHADQYVNGYYRNNGTYVQPYQRTAPNNTLQDNYSTRGNVNPYTGQAGTVNPYQQPSYGNNYGVNNLNRRGY